MDSPLQMIQDRLEIRNIRIERRLTAFGKFIDGLRSSFPHHPAV